jgi:hypothetical protein
MKRKIFNKKRSCPNAGAIPTFSWRDQIKPRITSVSAVDVPTEIQTEHFRNMNQGRYSYANPLGASLGDLQLLPTGCHEDYSLLQIIVLR